MSSPQASDMFINWPPQKQGQILPNMSLPVSDKIKLDIVVGLSDHNWRNCLFSLSYITAGTSLTRKTATRKIPHCNPSFSPYSLMARESTAQATSMRMYTAVSFLYSTVSEGPPLMPMSFAESAVNISEKTGNCPTQKSGLMLSEIESILDVPATLGRHNKRWHLAFATIYCSRALHSLLNKKKSSKPPVSTHSFVVLSVEPHLAFPNIDHTSLTAVVKEKNLDQLRKLGGVEGVADALKTDTKSRLLKVSSTFTGRRKGGMMFEKLSKVSNNIEVETPLQARLNKLTSSIGKFNGSKTKADDIVNAMVRIIAAAVTIRMMADQAMVRKLSACETMGSATTICTDKTGTLTLNQMKVTKYWLGKEPFSEAFNSEKKRSGILMRKKADNKIHVHWKGAAEMILAMCSSYYDASGSMKELDDGERMTFEQIIQGMAASSLQDSLTLIGLVGIKDPCRPGVRKAVEDCQYAGVNYTSEERMEKVDKICVMARSSPFDKLLMVQCLKQKGHVVAVTGDGTNDAPALKEADIGLSMGIQGTEVAKESSDIIILDDNFASVATVLRWGRSGEVPLTAVQLLWVNLIMDTLGALALATEQPTKELMEKPPVAVNSYNHNQTAIKPHIDYKKVSLLSWLLVMGTSVVCKQTEAFDAHVITNHKPL
ncbi:unnamed protein product, partial [Vitis vinifera]